MINLSKLKQEDFLEVEVDEMTTHCCACCRTNLSESTMYINNNDGLFNEYEIDSYDDVKESIDGRQLLCQQCYNKVECENSECYNQFLDIVFERDERAKSLYKAIMRQHQPELNVGSTRVMNKIINKLFSDDYFDIKIDELGVFDTQNKRFVYGILYEFGGINIDTMKAAANRKAKMLNRSYNISVDDNNVDPLYKKRCRFWDHLQEIDKEIENQEIESQYEISPLKLKQLKQTFNICKLKITMEWNPTLQKEVVSQLSYRGFVMYRLYDDCTQVSNGYLWLTFCDISPTQLNILKEKKKQAGYVKNKVNHPFSKLDDFIDFICELHNANKVYIERSSADTDKDKDLDRRRRITIERKMGGLR